jgi:hypothetical protein
LQRQVSPSSKASAVVSEHEGDIEETRYMRHYRQALFEQKKDTEAKTSDIGGEFSLDGPGSDESIAEDAPPKMDVPKKENGLGGLLNEATAAVREIAVRVITEHPGDRDRIEQALGQAVRTAAAETSPSKTRRLPAYRR